MSNNKNEKRERVCRLDGHKPIELMTTEERDDFFKATEGLTYAEFCEKYKNDTVDIITKELRSGIKTID